MNTITTIKQVLKVLAFERHWDLREPLALLQRLDLAAVEVYYRRVPVCELSHFALALRDARPVVEHICSKVETWLPLALGWLGEDRPVVWS